MLEQPVGFFATGASGLDRVRPNQFSVMYLLRYACSVSLYNDGRWDVTLLSKHEAYQLVVFRISILKDLL